MGKPWFRSKTIWVNGVTAAAAVLAAVAGLDFLDGTQLGGLVVGILGAVNVALRVITTEPVTVGK